MIALQVVIFLSVALLILSSDLCNPSKQPVGKKDPLPDDIHLPESYKVTGVISDWTNRNVSAFVEVANADRVSISVSSRNGIFSQWITTRVDNNTYFYNKTTGQCDKTNSSFLHSFSELAEITGDLSSMSTLINGLVDFSKKFGGVFSDNRTVAGIDGVYWVSCVNSSNGSANLQVEVVFAGIHSLKPPTYDNPLLLFLQIAEYGNFSDGKTVRNQLSLSFDSYDHLSEDDNRLFMPPPGVVCSGWIEERIPFNVSDPFSVLIEITDEKKLQYESIVHYSAAEEMVIVTGAGKGGIRPFISEGNVPETVVSVVHDFSSGYEYQLDHSHCVNLSALPSEVDDVVVNNGTYTMQPVVNIFFPPEVKFGNYGVVTSENGRLHSVYRGIKNRTNETFEVHLDGNQLHSYAVYKNLGSSLSISSYMKLTPVPYISVISVVEKMQSCFAQSTPNATFTLDVRSRTLKDVYVYGTEKVTSAIIKALRTIAPINPLRVRIFFGSGDDNLLKVFFSVEEKTDVKPSLVPSYNYTAEVSSSVLIEKLNETISREDWKFSVPSLGKNAEEWIIAAKSLRRYIPSSLDPIASYGYTGGAMFVLGVFTLVLGVAIGAGGVFFVTKRQRISNLAYQVFE